MSERFDQLSARHGNLRARCAIQRQHLAQTSAEIEQRLGGIDRGVNLVRNIAQRPAVIVGGVALVALIGPKRLLRWVGRGAVYYTTARRLLRMVR